MTPDNFTNQELFVAVGDGHELYVHDWGNPKAKVAILFLHGGPGGGCKDRHKGAFDPEKQRVIFHDQRGSGQSMPKGSLEHNTTAELVEDIERIAKELKLSKFVPTGGSWGSTLALTYALKYPKRVVGMVLNGIFTGSQAEIDYLDKGGWRTHFPDVWQHYLEATPKRYHDNPTAYHAKNMLGDNPKKAFLSAYAYCELEDGLMKLDDRHTPEDIADFDPSATIVEVHYLQQRCFLPDRYILQHASRLSMPIYLVQGRYDMVCPPQTAYELHQILPNSQLLWTINGHHTEHEAWNIIRNALAQLTYKF